jgi:glycosyltransferase involved in cell wall biosynthesis
VDSELFTPARRSDEVEREMRERSGIPAESIALLYAGRISPEKNIGLLAEMMRHLAADTRYDYRLLVAGAGPQSDWLRTEAERVAPGKVKLLGHLDKETLADYYANADVFVHPNPKEPFGIAPLEAMASGVPTVAPNAGGILSYATSENAWLVEPSGDDFAAAVRDVVENDELRQAKVARAVETARANTREASTDRLFATYDRIYEHFEEYRELFVDIEEAKNFDFVGRVLTDN